MEYLYFGILSNNEKELIIGIHSNLKDNMLSVCREGRGERNNLKKSYIILFT